jgi:tetratricopeptide (TPR) repeat protein
MRRYNEAAEEYKQATTIDPTHSNAYNNLSLVYHSLGRYREAFDCLIMAESAGARVNPDFKKALQEKLPQ